MGEMIWMRGRGEKEVRERKEGWGGRDKMELRGGGRGATFVGPARSVHISKTLDYLHQCHSTHQIWQLWCSAVFRCQLLATCCLIHRDCRCPFTMPSSHRLTNVSGYHRRPCASGRKHQTEQFIFLTRIYRSQSWAASSTEPRSRVIERLNTQLSWEPIIHTSQQICRSSSCSIEVIFPAQNSSSISIIYTSVCSPLDVFWSSDLILTFISFILIIMASSII